MNGNKILFDTNAVIYFINSSFDINNINIFISVISEIELLSYPKITQGEENKIRYFLNNNVNIINLDENIKNETISIRKNFNIKIPDAIIIAITKVNNLSILKQDEGILKFNEKISVKMIYKIYITKIT